MKLSDLFNSKPSQPLPLQARRWEDLLVQTAAKSLRVEFVRPRDGLGFEPAQLGVSFIGGARQAAREIAQWDLRLDDWLLEHRARAVDAENEGERFGYRLRELLEEPDQRYGSGFYNSVLVRYLHESELANQPSIRQMLAAVHEYRPSDSESARDCAAFIEQGLVETAQALAKKLEYPRPEAIAILSAAIAYYLDERFNVTTRKQLGFG